MTPYYESDNHPEWCRKLVKTGWRFRYDPATRFVSAEHPLGGKQSIAEIMRIARTGFDANEFGRLIAAMLNGLNNHRSTENGE